MKVKLQAKKILQQIFSYYEVTINPGKRLINRPNEIAATLENVLPKIAGKDIHLTRADDWVLRVIYAKLSETRKGKK